ncbi:hypothetical protein KFE96_13810 [Kordiimonas sp. SCSIO 12603]|uniref:hypothetical protein n=1 Tax=Kordiimonas sp. SCSIO 12603 TaxID=2829596 RepID=UPI0021060394|nr:hypothetical protein [Kordiimonas sp. SCSIO 12603]UTW57893.1 hypothetical protein KFE96_13810 [Kordiimonas sp. SCSIO 12603]
MASSTSPYQMAANQSRTEPSDDFASGLLMTFRSKAKAFAFTMAIMVVLFTFYIFVHIFRDIPEKPWANAFVVSPTGYLQLDIKEDILLRFFSPVRSREIIEKLDDDFKKRRDEALTSRKGVLNEAGRAARWISVARPTILTKAGIAVVNPNALRPATDQDYKMADLAMVREWFVSNRSEYDYEQQGTSVEYLIDSITKQIQLEEGVVKQLRLDAIEKDYDLPFLWLYHEGYGWVFELVFWSVIGVLVNTLFSLSRATRSHLPEYKTEGNEGVSPYSPTRFLLMFPQLCIAPVVALIVGAFVITGVTGVKFNLSNLPWFLIFAFVSGFASERMMGILQASINKLIPRFGIVEQKIDALYGDKARQDLRNYMLSRQLPNNSEEFQIILRDRVKSRMALETVKQSVASKSAALEANSK